MRPAAGELGDRVRVETGAAGRVVEVGGQGQARPDQQRSHRDQCPVGKDALHPRPRHRHAPQGVQLVLDRDQQQHADRGRADNADSGRLRRRTGEILEPVSGLLADAGDEVAEHQLQQFFARTGQVRKRRQDPKPDNPERDQRNERRVAERARGRETAVVVEAVQRVEGKCCDRDQCATQSLGRPGHPPRRPGCRPAIELASIFGFAHAAP